MAESKTEKLDTEEESKIEQKREYMITQPVEKLVCKMAVPTVISMLVTAIYNFADTFFVGNLGSSTATSAVGLSFSFMAIVQAIGCFYGHGSGNFISRESGKGNYEDASKIAATGFFSSVFTGIVLAVLGLVFRPQLALLLGSHPPCWRIRYLI